MTIIAWDGKTLAADKQSSNSGHKHPVTKIRKIGSELVFAVGDFDAANELMDWYKKGADPKTWPSCQMDKNFWCPLHVIRKDRTIWKYERRAYPYRCEGKFFAAGSGRDYALAAMALGHDSKKAVEVTCELSYECGMGIDTLTLED